MATENKGVMVYLPKEVEEYITSFCTEYSITRKDKEGNILPSLGTGIVTYLKSQMSGESPGEYIAKSSKLPSNGLSKEEVSDLVNEYLTSHLPSSGLSKDEVIDLIERSVTNNHSPQSIGARDIEVALEPIKESVSELEAYTQSQFVAMRDELKKAIGDRSATTEAVDRTHPKVVATAPDPVSPTDDGVEYLSFHQLATQLGYELPADLKDKPPQARATALIAYAATLGQSYEWKGKKQKFYRIEV
jgi:hypothetical protein